MSHDGGEPALVTSSVGVRAARLVMIGITTLTVGSCAGVWAYGSEVRWRPAENVEVVHTGLSIAVLWTTSGGSSVAMDCLPGIIPQCDMSRTEVFIDFPFWILLIGVMTFWFLLGRRLGAGRRLTPESTLCPPPTPRSNA